MLGMRCSMMVLPFQLQRGCPAAAKQGCQLLPWLQRHRQLAQAVRGCAVGMHPRGKLAACPCKSTGMAKAGPAAYLAREASASDLTQLLLSVPAQLPPTPRQFIRPPWHTMPLPSDVDWAGLGVFINITSEAPWLAANETAGGLQSQAQINYFLAVGQPTASVAGVTVSLPSLQAAYDYLR